MTTDHHDPHAFGAPLTAAEINAPLGQLDAAISAASGFAYNVMDYGAVGDGVADDSVAIRAAEVAAAGSPVYLPAGTYLVSGAMALVFSANGSRYVGAGRDATVIKYTGSGVVIGNSNTALIRRRVGIESLQINTQDASSGHRALEVDNLLYGVNRDVWLNGLGGDGTGIKLLGSAAKSTYFNLFDNVSIVADVACVDARDGVNANRFLGGVWEGPGIAIKMQPVTDPSDTNIFDSVNVQTTNATVVHLGGGGALASDNQFVNCRFEPSAANFIFDADSARNVVLGGTYANVTFVIDDVLDANSILLLGDTGAVGGLQIDAVNSTAKKTINLRHPNAGITFGDDALVNWYRRYAGGMHTDAALEASGAIVASQGATLALMLSDNTLYAWGSATHHDVGIVPKGNGVVAIEGFPLRFMERADPAAPAANYGVVYAKDNGSGKTQLVVRFASGAVQVLATEP